MAEQIKIRTQTQGNITEIKFLLPHPMETGLRKDSKTGQPISIHFIQQISIHINNKKIIEVHASQAISRDPVFVFKVKDIKVGNKISVNWLDNQGNTDSNEIFITTDKT